MFESSLLAKRSRLRGILFSVLGYAVSLGCLIWVFTGVNWRNLGVELIHAGLGWLIIAAFWGIGAQIYHAWRWNLLLRPVSRLKLWRTARALYIGLFANEVLPLRPGELIRSYLLAAWNQMAFSVAVSSVALERLLDAFSLTVAFSMTMAFLSLPPYLITGMRLLAGFLVLASFLLLIFLWRMRGGARPPGRFTGRLRPAMEGIRRMANARTLAASVIASLVQLALFGFPFWALSRACRLNLSVWAVIAVLIIVRVATIIPNTPGNAGVLQAACVLALGLLGIDKTRATAYAALLFVVATLPILIAGAAVVAITGVKIRELLRGTAELATVDSPVASESGGC